MCSPTSARCGCYDGFTYSGNFSCVDIDECGTSDKGGCEQSCNNFDGGYNCTCAANYKLGDDEKSCSSA